MSDPKDVILARRARFIAAAVAGIGAACSKTPSRSEPCLSQVNLQQDAEAPPGPCLSVPIPRDAATPPPPPTSRETPDAGQPRPTVCLKVMPPMPKDPG